MGPALQILMPMLPSPAIPADSDSDVPDEPAKKARVQNLWEDEDLKDYDQRETELRESIEAAEESIAAAERMMFVARFPIGCFMQLNHGFTDFRLPRSPA